MTTEVTKSDLKDGAERCYKQMMELDTLMALAFERGKDGIKPYAPELEAWVDNFTQTNDSLLLCVSAVRSLFRVKPVVGNFTELNTMGRKLCEVYGEDYDRVFRGVTEDKFYQPARH